jgi:hypothetical protein
MTRKLGDFQGDFSRARISSNAGAGVPIRFVLFVMNLKIVSSLRNEQGSKSTASPRKFQIRSKILASSAMAFVVVAFSSFVYSRRCICLMRSIVPPSIAQTRSTH